MKRPNYFLQREFCPKIIADFFGQMKDIINKCTEYSAASLTEIAQKQMPWKVNYVRNEHRIIPNENIKRYFET